MYDKFGTSLGKSWPDKLEVTPEFYGRACQAIFNHIKSMNGYETLPVAVGPNGGLMVKGVEFVIMENRICL